MGAGPGPGVGRSLTKLGWIGSSPPRGRHAPDAVRWLSLGLDIESLVGEIRNSAGRISELVGAMKDYSHLDQGPFQELDIHDGLDSTLVIFSHKLKKGVEVIRDYDRDLPPDLRPGRGANQVWTNIIHNAIDAMGGEGTLTIRTSRDRESLSSSRLPTPDRGFRPNCSGESLNRSSPPRMSAKVPASVLTSATGSSSGATTGISV